MTTIPEKPETIEAQMQWLYYGKRKAVQLTPGERLPCVPDGLGIIVAPDGGIIIFNISYRAEVLEAIKTRRMGDILGYGIPRKPEPGSEAGAVVIRGRNGHEKQSVVTDSVSRDAVEAAARQMADPGDTVTLEPCEKVVEERLRGFMDDLPKVLPLKTEEEVAHLMAVASENGQHPVLPTHYVEKSGEVVGSVSVASVPLYTLWLHKDKVKSRETAGILNVIENAFRVNGVKLVGTVIDDESPFARVAERGGYHAERKGKLYWRKL